MTTEERLLEAETDLEALIVRASNAMPTLRRIAEDASDWRKDIRSELSSNLQKAIDTARTNQARRRCKWPVVIEDRKTPEDVSIEHNIVEGMK
jgi:hypothetical protein